MHNNTSRGLTLLMYALSCAVLLYISGASAITQAEADAHAAGVVNLNTATAAELERLPRVGPARAQAILALRAKLTQFAKVEQLLRVKGIGRSAIKKWRPLVKLDIGSPDGGS